MRVFVLCSFMICPPQQARAIIEYQQRNKARKTEKEKTQLNTHFETSVSEGSQRRTNLMEQSCPH